MSQQELGSAVKANGNAVHRYESGSVCMQVDRLCQIADVLNVSPLAILPKRYADEPPKWVDEVDQKLSQLPEEVQANALLMFQAMLDGLIRQQKSSEH